MHCEAILAPKGVLQDEESVIEPQSADFILVPTEIPPEFLNFFLDPHSVYAVAVPL